MRRCSPERPPSCAPPAGAHPLADLAVLYEHPAWFAPLFATLDRRGIAYTALTPGGGWDPTDAAPPAPVILNRVAMSSATRVAEHPIFDTVALLDHWARAGADVMNGAAVMAIDASKARQLSLVAALGLAIPATRVVHRTGDVVAAGADVGFPLVVKANIGGAGAGIVRYDDADALAGAVQAGTLPTSVDGVLLVQAYVTPRGGTITRIETLEGRFLYALDIAGGGAFDLCPADACQVGGAPIPMRGVTPTPELIDAAERIARAVGMDAGGVEVMIDDADGTARFYDINALSNFVARPLEVLGWDPHERLVDVIERRIAGG